LALAAPLASSLPRQLTAQEQRIRLIVRGERPLNAETPVSVFDRLLTPTESFFVRSHFRPPAVGLRPWVVRVEGLVERPFQINLKELDTLRLEPSSIVAVLQCAGNGRAFFEPVVPGVPWRKGAVGCAEWSGVRLADLIRHAGLQPQAAHVHTLTADIPPHPQTPPFLRSIPLDRALHPSTLLATHINGEPLPAIHGGPLRLIVPGWTGNHWIKWIRGLVVSSEEAPGFYQQTAYRMPLHPVPPGTNPPPDQLVPVTELNIKSLFARPEDGAIIASGRQRLVGAAWSGFTPVERVEISINRGPWTPAQLGPAASPFAWRIWQHEWDPTPGHHELAVRATDAHGTTQPESTPWNKSGYLWNGIDRVRVEVRA
jgi:DMSO/TMAO reductase YedYZ molybdopterin-dependent catalytic subunit